MSMDVQIDDTHATFRVQPDHGRAVTFEVRLREVDIRTGQGWRRNMQRRYVVGLLGSDGAGFAHFLSFEKACSAALSRARRYERAYAKPRGVQVRARLLEAS